MLKALLTDLLRLKVLAIALALFAVACAGEPTPTPAVAPVPVPTPTVMATPVPTATPSPPTTAQIFARISPSVAFIQTPAGTGSGVLIEGGYVLTNAHVVWPFEEVRVVFPDGSEYLAASVLNWDLMGDLAVVGPLQTAIDPLFLEDGEHLAIGSDVFLIGYPAEAEEFPQPTITRGILSRLREWKPIEMTYFQTDAAITGGQSGGVLVSGTGEVIGISGFLFGQAPFGLVASAADVLPRVKKLVSGEDVAGLGQRNLPLGGDPREFDSKLRNAWDTRVYVINEPVGTTLDIEVESDIDVAFLLTDMFGNSLIRANDCLTGVESASARIELPVPHYLIVGPGGEDSGDFLLKSNVTLTPIWDVDDGTETAVGQTTLAAMDSPFDFDYFMIDLEAGQTIDITVDAMAFDPFLTVAYVGAKEEEVISDDNSGGGIFGTNAKLTYRAPHSGSYFIVVNAANGSRVGGYFLGVYRARPGASPSNPSPPPTPDAPVPGYHEAIQSTPEDAKGYYNRGIAYTELGRYEDAIQDYNEAIRLSPRCAEFYNYRGIAYTEMGQQERAIKDHDEAIRLSPKTGEFYFHRARTYTEMGQQERAIKDYDEAIRLNPQLAVAFNNRGLAYNNLGQRQRAIEDLDEAIRLDPQLARAYVVRGTAYIGLGQNPRAIQDLNEAIRLDPKYAPAYNNRGNAYYALGQHEKAIDDYAKAISLDPDGASAFYNRGGAYLELGQLERSIQDLDQAIRLNSQYVDTYFRRGLAYSRLGQLERSIEDYDEVIRLNPQYVSAYNNRGRTYSEIGQHERAIKDYDEAIRQDPQRSGAYNNRGNAYAELGQLERAIEDYDQAIQVDPNISKAYNNRGIAYRRLSQYQRAIQDHDEAIRLKPDDGDYYFHRALTYTYLHMDSKAQPDVERALELGFDKALLDSAIREIDKKLGLATAVPVAETPSGYIRSLDARVTGLQFFETPQDSIPYGTRVYSQIFDGSTTRSIGWELSLTYPAPGRRIDFVVDSVYYRSDGTVFLSHGADTTAPADGVVTKISLSPPPGNWPVDTYRVDLSVEGELVASGKFEVKVDIARQPTATPTHTPVSAEDRARALTARSEGAAFLNEGEYQKAIEKLDEAIRFDPQYANAYNMRAFGYKGLGRNERAIQDYDEAIRLDPQLAGAYAGRGAVYYDLGQYHRAVEDLDEAIRLDDPQIAVYHHNRGNAYLAMHQLGPALQDYSEAIRLDRRLASSYAGRAAAYTSLGKDLEAQQDAEKAIELGFDRARLGADIEDRIDQRGIIPYGRAEVYYQDGQYQQAIDRFDIAIQLDPNDGNSYWYRGNAHRHLGQDQRAIQDYDEVIRLDSENCWAHSNSRLDVCKSLPKYSGLLLTSTPYTDRGIAHSNLGQDQRAIKDFTEAIRLDRGRTRSSSAYYHRGAAYSKLGQYQQAILEFDGVIQKGLPFAKSEGPDQARMTNLVVLAYLARADGYNKLGREQEAKSDRDSACQLDATYCT